MLHRICYFISAIALLLATACTTTTTTTLVQDTGRQAVLYESARAPHMRGPGLKPGQIAGAVGYNATLGPKADGYRLPGQPTGGGAIAKHTVDGRLAFAMGDPIPGGQYAWEFGLNLGLTHASMAQAQAEDFYLSTPSDVYARVGLGFRGPVFEREDFVLGLNFEMDFSALPYRAEVIRGTQQFVTVKSSGDPISEIVSAILFLKPSPGETIRFQGESYDVESDIETGHAFFPTFRAGIYANYRAHQYISLSGGLSLQNTPAVNGIETQTYQCEHRESGGDPELRSEAKRRELAQKCRDEKGEDFPIVRHAFATTLYAGMHLTLDDFTISLRAHSNIVFSSYAAAFASPIAGDIELSYRF